MAAYAALVSVMHVINNLELHPHPPISLHKNQLLLLTQKITFLQQFLEGYDPHQGYSTEADPLEIRIADAAYAAEDAIESHIVDQIISDGEKTGSDASLYEALEKVIEEMALIKQEVMEINKSQHHHQLHRESTPPHSLDSSSADQRISMVGVDDLLRGMKEKLTSNCRDLQIIPVVGMGGTGKTTLAINMYQDRLIREHFYICGWATISQEYSVPAILEEILRQLNEKSGHELGERLYKHLFGRKYLIILDDMWSIDAWDSVRSYFPDNKNGSRIVVTTRLSDLASKLSNSDSLEMKLLDESSSWDLLSKTVFGEKSCPPELEEIGKRIGNSCQGLPLSIVVVGGLLAKSKHTRGSWKSIGKNLNSIGKNLDSVVGGLLAKSKHTRESWKSIGKSLNSIGKNLNSIGKNLDSVVGGLLAKSKHTRESWKSIGENLNSVVNLDDNEHCLKILYLSYKHLPVQLKPCFLYMGVFPEDEVISVSRVVKLWVAEGFLKPLNGKTLEAIARACLKDLVDRNLILIHKIGSTGNIKECKLHDLLRDLCLREAEKERFYIDVERPHRPQESVDGQRRIVVSRGGTTLWRKEIDVFSSMSQARSLIWNHVNPELPSLRLIRLLRVLSLSLRYVPGVRHTFIYDMHLLVNSRFVNVIILILGKSNFPSSIKLYWNLQTLIAYGSNEVDAPTEIWSMPYLRHVMVDMLNLPDPPKGEDGVVLTNLQTLGKIKNFNCSEQVVRRIPNIEKLETSYKEATVGKDYLSNLYRLDKLESFACTFHEELNVSGPSLRGLINFPHSLKKLSLQIRKSQFWQDILDKVGELPLLQKLKLKWGSFREGQWETTEGQFRSLKFLAIDSCDSLEVWTIESSHFPCLEQLVLDNLDQLEEIPLDFAEISTLGGIKVDRCSESAAISAKRILDEQEDLFGEVSLQVQVRLLRNNEELESAATPNFRVVC